PVERTDILSPVSPATVERLPGGELLMLWNNHEDISPALEGKRTPLTAALSLDEGRTWTHRRNLEDLPTGWYCYTALQALDDAVLLGYCAGDTAVEGGLERLRITRVPLAWFRSGDALP